MKKVLLVVGILVGMVGYGQPTIQWEVCLGGSGDDEAQSIYQTTDGGYIIAGFSNSHDGQVTNSHGGAWVTKLNANGILQWQKNYGGSSYYDMVYSIIQTTDGGYVFCGLTDSNNGDVANQFPNSDAAWVVKLNDTGAIKWSRCYGGTGNDAFQSVIQTADGGYICAGGTASHDGDITFNHGGADGWVVKIDSMGAIQWQKTYGGTSDEGFNSLSLTSDGGYIMAGGSASTDGDLANSGYHLNGDYWVVKVNDTGTIQWSRCYGGDGLDDASSIIQTSDGNYMVLGYTGSGNGDVTGYHGGWDYWLVNLNDTGAIRWQHCYGGSDDEIPLSVIQTQDGGYALGGWSNSTNGDVTGNHGCDFWIVKTDTVGAIQWQKCYGGNGCEYGYSMIQATDGGLVITGPTSTSNNGDVWGYHGGPWDYWVVKLNPYNVGIEVVNKEGGISVYPNPASTILTIHRSTQSTNSPNQQLTITDVFGRIVYSQLLPTTTESTIDISSLSNGIYFYEVRSMDGCGNKISINIRGKFIKSN